MKTRYETDRLIMQVCNTEYTSPVTDFYVKNFTEFAKYEPLGQSAKTKDYHRKNLNLEYNMFLDGELIRFYLFEKVNPLRVIGTLSYRDINHGYDESCLIGYKMDRDFRRKGYATEAILMGDYILFNEEKINRIEATVLTDNVASMNLLASVGYVKEGLLREKFKLNGQFLDHYVYSHLKRDMLL